MTTVALALWAAAAQAATVDFVCEPDPGAGSIVGTSPLDVHCAVIPPATGTWDDVSWTFGDGELVYGDEVDHRYVDPGQYTVTVQLDGYVDAEGVDVADPQRTEHGLVTVCGEPQPAFTYVNHGDLDYEFLNVTPIAVDCTDALRWELFRGAPDGEPERIWETWEPRVRLPDEGEYTMRLTMAGLGGDGAAQLQFYALHKLTDDLTQGPKAMACATAPGAAPWLGLGALGALLVRRRQRQR
ncbi:MAG: PKD domain-containing protein [Myxococcota bacterium]